MNIKILKKISEQKISLNDLKGISTITLRWLLASPYSESFFLSLLNLAFLLLIGVIAAIVELVVNDALWLELLIVFTIVGLFSFLFHLILHYLRRKELCYYYKWKRSSFYLENFLLIDDELVRREEKRK